MLCGHSTFVFDGLHWVVLGGVLYWWSSLLCCLVLKLDQIGITSNECFRFLIGLSL